MREVSDKFEEKGKDFLVKIKSSYEQVFLNNKKAVKVLTDSSMNDVQMNIQKHLDKLIDE
jgi:thymidylate kinase